VVDARRLRIGIDLDNTLVCYERLFPALARERGLVPADCAMSRIELRDRLRAEGREHLWTELQGEAYGPRMREAPPFDGALEFLARCHRAGAAVFIVSHRSRKPYSGGTADLHDAAHRWLEHHGFAGDNGGALPQENVRLEPTLGRKIDAIAALGLSHFVDDLPELFAHERFPAATLRILFDPTRAWEGEAEGNRVASWNEVSALLFGMDE
jgi:hypothetical protein